MAKESKPAAAPATPAVEAPAAQAAAPTIPTDSSQLSTVYTNFARVSVTPEELVLDFGLNTQMIVPPTEAVKLSHRVVMNFYTAKRLLAGLLGVLQQHENVYGPLELDFQKRIKGNPNG